MSIDLRWGRVSRRWTYAWPENSASMNVSCRSFDHNKGRNIAGTSGGNWHKIYAMRFPNVLPCARITRRPAAGRVRQK